MRELISEWTHKATLQSMINEVNEKIAGMDSQIACQEAVKEFFAMLQQAAKQALQREVGKGHRFRSQQAVGSATCR